MKRMLLDNNGLHWANNDVPSSPKSFINFLRDYRQVKEASVDACLTGGAVYAAYGMRDVGDLDYVAARPLRPFLGGEANNEPLAALLRPLGLGIHHVMEDPRHHFYYFGDKVMAFRLFLQIRLRARAEIEGFIDLARAAAFRGVKKLRNIFPCPLRRVQMWLRRRSAK